MLLNVVPTKLIITIFKYSIFDRILYYYMTVRSLYSC
nr:MAG TPA: hypothetical protein [Bacteriophage sp.]